MLFYNNFNKKNKTPLFATVFAVLSILQLRTKVFRFSY
jgi:hypothetical protein